MEISATGENVFSDGFKSSKAKSHLKKHLKDYPGITQEEYEQTALELIQEKVGGDIHGYKTESGIVRYNVTTNDFVSGHPDIGVFTMMKLRNGFSRYEYLKKRDEKSE